MQQGALLGSQLQPRGGGPPTHLAHSDIAQGLLAVGSIELLELLLLLGDKLKHAVLELHKGQVEGGREGGGCEGVGCCARFGGRVAARSTGEKRVPHKRTVEAQRLRLGLVRSALREWLSILTRQMREAAGGVKCLIRFK